MKIYFLWFLLMFLSFSLNAQHINLEGQDNHREITLKISDDIHSQTSSDLNKIWEIRLAPVHHPFKQIFPFVSFSIKIDTFQYGQLWIRKAEKVGEWGKWMLVSGFHEKEKEDNTFISELMYLKDNESWIQAKLIFQEPPPFLSDSLLFAFFQPERETDYSVYRLRDESCSCSSPTFVSRTNWNCPDGQNPSCSSPVRTEVSHLIVHHSAGINQSNDWGAIVLSIWDMHVRTNNWCDIGYNWLIDPNGILYQGRGGEGDIRGAHFCGKNSGTMGVCLLGNFEQTEPTTEALNTLDSLLSWKSCERELDPATSQLHASSGRILQVISGHKDGCGTICPGANLYSALPIIRITVQETLDTCNLVSNINIENKAFSLEIFPNPNKGIFSIKCQLPNSTKIDLRLIDMMGKEKYQSSKFVASGVHKENIHLPPMTSGNYMLILSDGSKFLRSKMIQIY